VTPYDFTVDDYIEAASLGQIQAVNTFLEAGMSVDAEDAEGTTALLKAARSGHAPMVQHLLANGADVNYVGPGWDTPLIAASENGDPATIKFLLDAGAAPAQKNENNWTALGTAAFHGNADAIDLLAPASRDPLDEALHLASLQGHVEAIDRLLNHGASVFARSAGDFRTPLMFAAANGHLDAVKILLQNGANRFALDEHDLTAQELAIEGGFEDVTTYLSEPPTADELKPSTIEDLAPLIIAKYEKAAASLAVEQGTFILPDAPSFGNGDPGIAGASVTKTSVGTQAGSVIRTSQPAKAREDDLTEEGIQALVAGGPQGSGGSAVAYVQPFQRKVTTQRLAGSNVETIANTAEMEPTDVSRQFQMHDYRESQLPLMLTKTSGSDSAEVRMLYGHTGGYQTVSPGHKIPGTDLEVLRIEQKFAASKHTAGQLVDVSRILVEDKSSGERHLVVKDLPARTSEPFAVMSFGDAYSLYDVRAGDKFTGGETGDETFRVAEVRPTQVIIESIDSGETFTVQKATSRDF
jgi:ankyrin repeat protein